MNRVIFEKLTKGEAYDEIYKNLRGLLPRVKQIYNPVPVIIDTDVSLIRNSVKVRADEITSQIDWNYIKSKIIKEQLYDRAFVDIEIVNNKPVIFIYSSDQIACEYDSQGNIINAKINRESPFKYKEYYIDKDNKRWMRIEEEQALPILYENMIFPIFEISGRDEEGGTETISRIENLPDLLDLINKYEADMEVIFTKHADAPTWGQMKIQRSASDIEDNEIEHLQVEEGGEIKYLEMQGNVVSILKDKIEELKKQVKEQYPELKIQEAIQGSGESGYAISLKLLSLISIIELYRDNFAKGIRKLFNYIQEMLRLQTQIEVEVYDIIPQNQKEEITEILTLYQSGIIPLEIALEQIAELKKWSNELIERIQLLLKNDIDELDIRMRQEAEQGE